MESDEKNIIGTMLPVENLDRICRIFEELRRELNDPESWIYGNFSTPSIRYKVDFVLHKIIEVVDIISNSAVYDIHE